IDPQGFAGLQVVGHDLTVELDPASAAATDLLEDVTGPTEDSRSERALKPDRNRNLWRAAQKAVPMDQVAASTLDIEGQNLARYLRGEGYQSGAVSGRVVGHEQTAPADGALEHAKDALRTAQLSDRPQLDRAADPPQ